MFCSVGEIFYVRGVDRLAGRKINYMKVMVDEGRSYGYGYRAGTANRKEIEEMGAGEGTHIPKSAMTMSLSGSLVR